MLVYSRNNKGASNIFFLRLVNQKMSKAKKKIKIKAKNKSQFTKTVVSSDIVVFLYLKHWEGMLIFLKNLFFMYKINIFLAIKHDTS